MSRQSAAIDTAPPRKSSLRGPICLRINLTRLSATPSYNYSNDDSSASFLPCIAGGAQGVRAGAGAEDEQAPLQQQLHAQGDAAHEQAQTPKHSQVSEGRNDLLSLCPGSWVSICVVGWRTGLFDMFLMFIHNSLHT